MRSLREAGPIQMLYNTYKTYTNTQIRLHGVGYCNSFKLKLEKGRWKVWLYKNLQLHIEEYTITPLNIDAHRMQSDDMRYRQPGAASRNARRIHFVPFSCKGPTSHSVTHQPTRIATTAECLIHPWPESNLGTHLLTAHV